MSKEPVRYWNKEVETSNRNALEKLQLEKLRVVISTCWERNSFYRKRFEKAGVSPATLRSLCDLKTFPLLTKKELLEDQEVNPPFGSNLSGPLETYVRYHQTTGTTGRPLRWLDTKDTWEWRAQCAAMSLTASGVTPQDIMFFAFPFSPHVAFWGMWEGAYKIGALLVPGGGWSTLQRVRFIVDLPVTVIACTPSYALRMAEEAQAEGIDLRKASVRKLILAGEPGAILPDFRRRIRELWGAEPFDYPGLTEVGAYGMHCVSQEMAVHINEAEFIPELIDPSTGNTIGPEGEGELVLTNLGRLASPAIRYRTGDIVRMKTINCPCGRTFRVLEGGVLGRVDDMISVRGINIFPSQLEGVVQRHILPGEEFQVVVHTQRGMAEIEVRCELLPERGDVVLEHIKKALRDTFEVRIEVARVPYGTLPREGPLKHRRFVDLRKER